jgi:hypothetical protein
MNRDRGSRDHGPGKISQRRKSERRRAQPHQRRVADGADALVNIVVPVRQQIGRGREQDQRNGGKRQAEAQFVMTLWHLVFSLHLQHISLFCDHFVQHRVDEKSEEQPRNQTCDHHDRERLLGV